MNIDEMEAGREMDALVWMALNGKSIEDGTIRCRYVDGDVQPHAGYPVGHISPPHYSTNDAAALEITETWEYNWNICRDVGKSGSFETRGDRDYRVILSYPGMDMAGTVAPTLALAISRTELKRAALKAVTE